MKYWKLYCEILLSADSLVHLDIKKYFFNTINFKLSEMSDKQCRGMLLLYINSQVNREVCQLIRPNRILSPMVLMHLKWYQS